MSLTKHYIFLKVNLNVYTVVIKFYRNYVTNSLFYIKKILEIPEGRGVIKDPPGMENPGGRGGGGANQKVFRGGGMDIFWNHTMHQYVQVIECNKEDAMETAME